MKKIDDIKIKNQLKKQDIKIPEEYRKKVDTVLYNLDEGRSKYNLWKLFLNTAVAMIVFVFVVLPNINANVSYAMQQIPVIGSFVKVVTIKNYIKVDGKSEIELSIPTVKNDDNSKSLANEELNNDAKILTEKILKNYNENKHPDQHYSVSLTNEIITNTEEWFTLKLTTSEISASSDTRYKYYNIDKKQDKIIKLPDLFKNSNYEEAIKSEIKNQMAKQMKEDENVIYWTDSEKEQWDFVNINKNTNYYFSDNGNIVIVFDKYEVGPGYMGNPEFEISKEIYEKYL